MSQIAQALAKAKERTGQTTAPFMTSSGAPFAAASPERTAVSAATLRKARNTRVFWAILACVSLPLTGFILWTRLKPQAPAPAPATVAAVSHSASEGPAVSGGSSSPSSVAQSAPRASATLHNTPVPNQRPEVMAAVFALPISAVMPGDPARIMLAGRVVRAGELVEGELTFAGIADGQLRFTDGKGAVYTRHY